VSSFSQSVAYNLRSLTRFSGRDTRAQFWPYAFTLFCIVSAAGSLWMQFEMRTLIGGAPPSFGSGRHAHVANIPGGVAGLMEAIILGFGVGIGLYVLLMASAVARRLHDTDRTGAWGLLPVGFLTIGFAGFWRISTDLVGGVRPGGLFPLIFANNIAYLCSLVALVIMLAKDGTGGPNEFGPDPRPTVPVAEA
jgi:uncharacterized membrane protein YhaH (DUF805 family)